MHVNVNPIHRKNNTFAKHFKLFNDLRGIGTLSISITFSAITFFTALQINGIFFFLQCRPSIVKYTFKKLFQKTILGIV